MFRKVDCLLLRVPSLDSALEFYRDRLGLKLGWIRRGGSAGLELRDSDTELVLSQDSGPPETDLLVDSADEACATFVGAGGSVVSGPFDIPVGRCVVVKDPWGNSLVMLDTTKGLLKVGPDRRVVE